MTSSIITDHGVVDPYVQARFVDGRLDLLHLARRDPRLPGFAAHLAALRAVLSDGLAKHHAELLAETETSSTAHDPYHRAALAFAQAQLASAAEAVPLPQHRWFPDQADGRDATGTVHVSVRNDEVVILEGPPEMFDRSAVAGTAIREALNLALERREHDVLAHIHRRGGAVALRAPDWRVLAERASEWADGHR